MEVIVFTQWQIMMLARWTLLAAQHSQHNTEQIFPFMHSHLRWDGPHMISTLQIDPEQTDLVSPQKFSLFTSAIIDEQEKVSVNDIQTGKLV